MAKVLGYLIRHFSNYYTLHRSDLAARAAPLDPRLQAVDFFLRNTKIKTKQKKSNIFQHKNTNSF